MHDVLIVGGGIGGLTLALELELQRSNIPCRVFESTTRTYRELLDQIGEEAMKRANKALADLRKKSPRPRKPRK